MGEFNDSYYCPTAYPPKKQKNEDCVIKNSDAMDGFGVHKRRRGNYPPWG